MEVIIQFEKVNIASLCYCSILLFDIAPHTLNDIWFRHVNKFLNNLYLKRFPNKSFLVHPTHIYFRHNCGSLRCYVQQILALKSNKCFAHRSTANRHAVSNFLCAYNCSWFKFHANNFITECSINHLLHA